MKDRVASIQARLKALSKQWNKSHQLTLLRYLQERLLYRLSRSSYRELFVLKGGVFIYALERQASRPTLDLDLLARQLPAEAQRMQSIFREIAALEFPDGVRFKHEELEAMAMHGDDPYPGIRVRLEGTLGKIRQRLQIDIGFGDVIVPDPVSIPFPTLLDMAPPELWAYSIESVIAEKFEAMIDLAGINTRMKDFYDVYRLLRHHAVDPNTLEQAVVRTIQRRATPTPSGHVLFDESFAQDPKRLNQWRAFLRKMKLDTDLPFAEVWKTLQEQLQPIYEKLTR